MPNEKDLKEKRIEVFRDEQSARKRAEWMNDHGWRVKSLYALDKVLWDASRTTGVTDIASNEPEKVWVIEGEM